jgi:hypothetical protein
VTRLGDFMAVVRSCAVKEKARTRRTWTEAPRSAFGQRYVRPRPCGAWAVRLCPRSLKIRGFLSDLFGYAKFVRTE